MEIVKIPLHSVKYVLGARMGFKTKPDYSPIAVTAWWYHKNCPQYVGLCGRPERKK